MVNFNFELVALNCYVAFMSQKSGAGSRNGMNDVIGIILLAAALMLFVAQLSFDQHDISFLHFPPNKEAQNWIGTAGAHLAWYSFLLFGLAAYLLPFLFALFGVAFWVGFLGYLRERIRWSIIWAVLLLISATGLLFILDHAGWLGKVRESIGSHSAGGELGYLTYGQTSEYNYGFALMGSLGATIVYAALGIISLLFLTNFHLGNWVRWLLEKRPAPATVEPLKSADEINLEKRARELEKQKRKLEQEVERSNWPEKTAKSGSAIGADGLPVPEPTVRDLSVPQPKGPHIRKTTYPPSPKPVAPEPEPVKEEIIPAVEIRPATTAEILGAGPEEKIEEPKIEPTKTEAAEKVEPEKLESPKVEPVITIADGSVPPPKPKATPRKPKPITVASTPHDRQLPIAVDGFSPAPGHDGQADRVQGGIDGQRPAHAADARAIRH